MWPMVSLQAEASRGTVTWGWGFVVLADAVTGILASNRLPEEVGAKVAGVESCLPRTGAPVGTKCCARLSPSPYCSINFLANERSLPVTGKRTGRGRATEGACPN